MARRRFFGWGYGLKGRQDKESEFDLPELWRQRLMGYLGPQLIIIILVEMLLVGRGLFVVPLVLGLVFSRRTFGLLVWGSLCALLLLFAFTGAWWPVWWDLSFVSGPHYLVKVLDWRWWTLPGILAAVRILVGFITPIAWGASTALTTLRGAMEQVMPEVPNTPLTPVDLIDLLDLFGWARADEPEPEAEDEPVKVTVVHGVPAADDVEQVAQGVTRGGGRGFRSEQWPTEWFRGDSVDQKLLSQYQFADYVLEDPDTHYARNRTRTFFESSIRARWFFDWMKERHYAHQVNRTDQALTAAGIYLLERIAEDYENEEE